MIDEPFRGLGTYFPAKFCKNVLCRTPFSATEYISVAFCSFCSEEKEIKSS